MELFRPEAVRVANGTLYFASETELCRPFVTPSEAQDPQLSKEILQETARSKGALMMRHFTGEGMSPRGEGKFPYVHRAEDC